MRELHLSRACRHRDQSLATLHDLLLMLKLNHCNVLVGSCQLSFKLFNLIIFLVIHVSQLGQFRYQDPVLFIQKLILVLKIIMRSLVNVMFNNSLQLLKLLSLLSFDIHHLNFMLTFLLKCLFLECLELFFHLVILLLSLFVVTLDRRPIFLATFSLTLF